MNLKLGKMVRFHRKIAGLSQEELAKMAGVGKTLVFDIEKGKMTIRLKTLLQILEALNIQMYFQSPLMKEFEDKSHEKG